VSCQQNAFWLAHASVHSESRMHKGLCVRARRRPRSPRARGRAPPVRRVVPAVARRTYDKEGPSDEVGP
jgi:hypothetical protein